MSPTEPTVRVLPMERSALLELSLPDDGVHNLVRGIAARVAGAPVGTAFAARVEDGGRWAGLLLWTPPHRILLGAMPVAVNEVAIDRLVSHVAGLGWGPRGVLALSPHAEAFARSWVGRAGGAARIAMRERIYELREVAAHTPSPGQLRSATPGDRDRLASWMRAFSVEAGMLVIPTEAEALAEIGRRTAAGDLFAWEVEGRVVAMASFARPTQATIAINFVYTDPDARGRGHAGTLVAAMSARQLAAGRPLTCLHADLANPASNRAYLRVGFRPVGDALAFDFDLPP